MPAGAHQLCTVTLMDAGERPDFLPKYSSAKICLLPFLYEPVAEGLGQRKMRNWASRTDEGDKDKNKGESAGRNKGAESERKTRVAKGGRGSSVRREKKVRHIKRVHCKVPVSSCLDLNFFPQFCLNIKGL